MLRPVLFELYKRVHGDRSRLHQIKEIEKFSTSQIEDFRRERLKELMEYAYRHVPYYRELFHEREVIVDGKVRPERFNRLPLLSKTDIRENFSRLVSGQIDSRQWRYKTTGGSTGEPLKVIHDEERVGWVNSVKDLRNEWSGIRFGDPRVRIWGSERDLFYGKENLKTRLDRWVNNTLWLNAFHLTPEKMSAFVETINTKRPRQIKGYTTCLYEFARFVEINGLMVHTPDSIVCSAGTVTKTIRTTIERVFNARIYNSYGSREVQAMAFECFAHEGLHVMSPIVHMEIVDSHGNSVERGQVGEVVLTPFYNYAMPLFRYRIGDMATWSEKSCSCGCKWPLIKNIEGRVTECFYRADGTVVPPEFFIHLVGVVQNDGWISKFQVVQLDYLYIQIKLIRKQEKNNHDIQTDLAELTKKIQYVMTDECHVEYQFVDEIPNTPSGKYLYTISKINEKKSLRFQ